jgi:hypothetical protein
LKKALKNLKVTLLALFSLVFLMIGGLFLYTLDSYEPLTQMNDEIEGLDLSGVEVVDDFDQISYFVDQPKKNIVIVPGGKVHPESYRYLAAKLALAGYDVTIVKTLFQLAILTPNYGARFLRADIENVVIGHSLGGTVASIFSEGNDLVADLVFLASYPIANVSDKRVLTITGEFDTVLDRDRLVEGENFLPENHVTYEIVGGNHAQFGWYGPQSGDGTPTITTKAQQDIIVQEIINFIE